MTVVGGCGGSPCEGKWGIIQLTLTGLLAQSLHDATITVDFAGKTSGYAGMIFSCPGTGGGDPEAVCGTSDPPVITFFGYGTDITTVHAVTLTVQSPDGTVLIDDVDLPLTSAVFTMPEGVEAFCERTGTLPP